MKIKQPKAGLTQRRSHWRKLLLACFLVSGGMQLHAQENIRYRVILVGNAGEENPQQQAVLDHAALRILPNKTAVMFLGDNTSPRGMDLAGGKNEETAQKVLRSQYLPMRKKGAPVYFLPGNEDWDGSGPDGLEKIRRQSDFLAGQQDPGLSMVPANGCPDPVEIAVSDSLTILALDTEWWLYPYPKDNPGAECGCKTKADVAAQLEELLYKNRYKVVLLASHHPFKTDGKYGGGFSLRSLFASPQYLNHPLYRDLVKKMENIVKGYPNVMHVSGHDEGLQLINEGNLQVVSGGGSRKAVFLKKGSHSLYAGKEPGYVIADILNGNTVRFTFYAFSEGTIKQVFSYDKPYDPVKFKEDAVYAAVTADSVIARVHPAYDSVSTLHRKIFGENYRKEWAAPTRLPMIRISQLHGGLKPVSRGGGFQSKSLRLVDPTGKEWVIRSVEKNAEMLLPEALRETFARDVFDDAMSAQHPFSALVVPPIAEAARVPHAKPVIGVIAPDRNLGIYEQAFANTVCLLEEREPAGDSDNTPKMLTNLDKDNDNSYDATLFLRARLLDLLIGDWDRHEDQWRWKDEKKGSEKFYASIPRDRDQALYLNEGIVPWITARSWVYPTLQGFEGGIPSPRYSLFKTRFLNAHPAAQLSHSQWMKITNDFVASVTDASLEAGLARLPASTAPARRAELLATLKKRRGAIPAAMDEYYRFINKIADIRSSDKNEAIRITSVAGGGLNVTILKINKEGQLKDTLMAKTFDPEMTKEVRLYTGKGNDQVFLNAPDATIRLKIIAADGEKTYEAAGSKNKVDLYVKNEAIQVKGDERRFRKHVAADSLHTAFVPVNLYNVTMPLASFGLNADDGFMLSLGFKHTQQEGFRKAPYANVQQVMATHSFSTRAYKLRYEGEWIRAAGKADLLVVARINAPDNTINFFGRGNETSISKTGDYRSYYRTRFSYYHFDPALRWRNHAGTSIRVGPSLQYYVFDGDDNAGRSILAPGLKHAYDSLTIAQSKLHAGIVFSYTRDKRNHSLFTTWGSYLDLKVQGYKGLNSSSASYLQVIPEVALFKSLNAKSTIVLAERLGGTATLGKTTFYQSAFLGGNGNLQGYHQYRFAGQHSFYNNLELRIKAATFSGYLFPGQFGFTGFYDTGRVWENNETSTVWHHAVGGGVFLSPAGYTLFQLQAGYSKEGWYPYFTMKFRY